MIFDYYYRCVLFLLRGGENGSREGALLSEGGGVERGRLGWRVAVVAAGVREQRDETRHRKGILSGRERF